ncbi:MAG TPA: sulfotransferase [Anaerolineales bacterium]|nr:sulfotransferase [Anaerolineales bacterium]
MNDRALTPILVTGMHRSGTTWVGKMLAADACTAYISEPLNVLHRPGVFRPQIQYWYQFICEENENEYLPAFQELLEFDYHLLDEIRSLRSRKDFLRMGRDFLVFYYGLMRGHRVLFKDPFAVFSSGWFAKRLHCKVITTVRHPAAVVSSLKRLNWSFDFQNLLNQPLLMRDHLEPYRGEMLSIPSDDIVSQAALLWKIVYHTLHSSRRHDVTPVDGEGDPDFRIVRHEDLSLDPIPGYRALYSALDLEFTPRVEKIILNSSSSENPGELSRKKTHDVKLDSRATVGNWKKRLTAEEIARIREITEEVSLLYYSGADW